MRRIFLFLLLISVVSYSQTNIWDENPIDSQEELDSLLMILPNAQGEIKMPILNRVSEIYWLIDPNQTLVYAREALQLSLELNNKAQEGLALINLCQGYLFNDVYDKALELGLQSLEIRKELGNEFDLAFTLRTLGWLYYDIGYYDKALEYHQETLRIHEGIDDKQRIAYSYNSIGLIHARQGDCYLALSFYRKSLELKKEFNNKDRISETLKNMGICYRKINELKAAQEHLDSSLKIANEIKDYQNKVEILNELAIVNLELGNYEKSHQLLQESRLIIEQLADNKEWIIESDRILSEYYLQVGNYKKALERYKLYNDAKEDIFSRNTSEKLAEMRILHQAESKEAEIELLEQQRNLETQKQRYMLIGSVLLVIIGALIIFSLWNNIKKKKALFDQNNKLSEEKLKTQSLVRENLEHKLDFRMKELTNLALFISQRTTIYKELTESFKSLAFNDINQLKKDVSIIIKEYKFKFDFNEDIQKFHTNIETLQSEFLFRLKEKFPKLTDKDIRLAVQVKLKLSSKEIANLNNISLNSIEIGRHRLRKKLNLDKKVNLVEFLQNI